MTKPAGRVVFITGASSGIGRACAQLFASRGDRVFCVARDEKRLTELVTGIEAAGGVGAAAVCDVTKEADVERAIAGCVERFRGIDVLIPAAGIIASAPLDTMAMDAFDHMMAVNVRAVVHTMKCASPHLVRSRGAIVTISSTTGFRAFPGVFAYCISKAALEQATRCLALELAPQGVRVNGIAPGVIVTELHRRGGMGDEQYAAFLERGKATHPLGHVGETADASEAIYYLASPAAKFLTGVIIPVDGGRGITCLR